MKIDDPGDQLSHLHMRRFHYAHSVSKACNHADSRPTLCHRVSSISLAAPLDAQAWTQVQTWLSAYTKLILYFSASFARMQK
jgi:glycine cleavage system regulatory protein